MIKKFKLFEQEDWDDPFGEEIRRYDFIKYPSNNRWYQGHSRIYSEKEEREIKIRIEKFQRDIQTNNIEMMIEVLIKAIGILEERLELLRSFKKE